MDFVVNLLVDNHLSANNVGKTGLVVVCSSCDDVPLLPSATIAGFGLNGDQVLAEIARCGVHEEALPIRGLFDRQHHPQLIRENYIP